MLCSTKQYRQQIGFHPLFPVVTPKTKKCIKVRKLLSTISLSIRRDLSIIQKQDVLHRCVQDYWYTKSRSSWLGVSFIGHNLLFVVSDVQKQDKRNSWCATLFYTYFHSTILTETAGCRCRILNFSLLPSVASLANSFFNKT